MTEARVRITRKIVRGVVDFERSGAELRARDVARSLEKDVNGCLVQLIAELIVRVEDLEAREVNGKGVLS